MHLCCVSYLFFSCGINISCNGHRDHGIACATKFGICRLFLLILIWNVERWCGHIYFGINYFDELGPLGKLLLGCLKCMKQLQCHDFHYEKI